MLSETLSYQALDPVAINGTAAGLFRNRQPETGIAHPVRAGEYQKKTVGRAPSIAKNPTIFVGFQ